VRTGHPDGAVHTWSAPRALRGQAARTFTDLLSYCFGTHVDWSYRGGAPGSIDFVCTDPGPVLSRLDEAYRRAVGVSERVPVPVVDFWWRADGAGPQPVEGQPRQRWAGGAMGVGPGIQVAGPGLTRLIQAVDRLGLDLATALGAQEYTVSHLLSMDTVRRAGYDRTFPQHLTTCSVVRQDLGALDHYADCADDAERAALQQPAPLALSPAACLNMFAAFRGAQLDGPAVLTARVPCARYEAGAGHSDTRLWAYSVREIVYLGDLAGARTFRAELLARLAELVDDLDLPAKLQTAGDPFFSAEHGELAAYQNGLELKHEVCGRLAGSGAELAVGSVNLHNQHFGQAFDIRLGDGSPASSACLGFGLERFARWLHGHLGDRTEDLPQPLKSLAPNGC